MCLKRNFSVNTSTASVSKFCDVRQGTVVLALSSMGLVLVSVRVLYSKYRHIIGSQLQLGDFASLARIKNWRERQNWTTLRYVCWLVLEELYRLGMIAFEAETAS